MEIKELQVKHMNEDIVDLINKFCIEIHGRDSDSITYRGFMPYHYLNFNQYLSNNFTRLNEAFNGYREVYYSNLDIVSIVTVEGDIYITLFDTVEAYNEDMAKSLEFYKEN